jgi:DNA-binding IscR family transcriptional regulator
MMSMKCKYAIKALIKLSVQKDTVYISTSEIARSENIPKKFLEQILLELKMYTGYSTEQYHYYHVHH